MLLLIDELKDEHVMIVDTLKSIERLGVYSIEGRKKLLTAKNDFLAHLKKEDDELYPALKKIAENNKTFKKKVDHLSKNIEEVTMFVLQFFDKYATGGSATEYKVDCDRLYSILKARILNEEILYKEYKKLKQSVASSCYDFFLDINAIRYYPGDEYNNYLGDLIRIF